MTAGWFIGVMCGGLTLALLGAVGNRLHTPRLPHTPPSQPMPLRRGGRRRRRGGDAMADDLNTQRYLEALARSVRAGRTLSEALRLLTPSTADTSRHHLLHDTLVVASGAGASPAAVLEHGAAVAADRVAARQERRAHAAQARLSATVLTWVPGGVAALAILTDGDVRRVMLTTPLGWMCIGAGGGLSVLGRRWIRRITEGPAT
jgi:Flp pilus assembly protein TadB